MFRLLFKKGPPNYGPKAKTDPRSYFVNNENIYEKLVDFIEYNISRNNHIA